VSDRVLPAARRDPSVIGEVASEPGVDLFDGEALPVRGLDGQEGQAAVGEGRALSAGLLGDCLPGLDELGDEGRAAVAERLAAVVVGFVVVVVQAGDGEVVVVVGRERRRAGGRQGHALGRQVERGQPA